MNIASIKVKMMISTTGAWLGNEAFCAQLAADEELGAGVLAGLDKSHHFLADLANRRKNAQARLRKAIDRVTELDRIHDDKARGLHYALDALISLADDDDERESYRELQARLFPLGLRIVSMTHLEESGAAKELELAVGPALRAKLASLRIGEQSLEQVLDDWLAAGKALGLAVAEREQLKASLKRKGSAVDTIDIGLGRKRWVQAVKGLLWLLDFKPEHRKLVEPVESALALAIDLSTRKGGSPSSDAGEGEADEGGDDAGEGDDEALDDDALDADEGEGEALGDDEDDAGEGDDEAPGDDEDEDDG